MAPLSTPSTNIYWHSVLHTWYLAIIWQMAQIEAQAAYVTWNISPFIGVLYIMADIRYIYVRWSDVLFLNTSFTRIEGRIQIHICMRAYGFWRWYGRVKDYIVKTTFLRGIFFYFKFLDSEFFRSMCIFSKFGLPQYFKAAYRNLVQRSPPKHPFLRKYVICTLWQVKPALKLSRLSGIVYFS